MALRSTLAFSPDLVTLARPGPDPSGPGFIKLPRNLAANRFPLRRIARL
jgi:hypothetical protein